MTKKIEEAMAAAESLVISPGEVSLPLPTKNNVPVFQQMRFMPLVDLNESIYLFCLLAPVIKVLCL